MSLFAPSEVFQFAIRIEENGEKFYRRMADKFQDKQIKEMFSNLADEEVKHAKTYKTMVSKLEKYEPFESFPDEYFTYLKAYADKLVFDEKSSRDEVLEIENIKSALRFAIDKELDSILYYQEIRNLVSEGHRDQIDKIINEERKHFVRLSACLNKEAGHCSTEK